METSSRSTLHAQSIFEYDFYEAIGKNICDLIPSAMFCDSSEGCAVNLLEFTQSEQGGEIEGVKSDGSTIPLEIVVSEFTHAYRTSFTAMLRDLTRRKQLETQLAHAQKMESLVNWPQVLRTKSIHRFNMLAITRVF